MVNMGKIGYSRYAISRDGDVYSLNIKRMLSKQCGTDGYFYHTLYPDEGKHVTVANHRLVGLMFLENDEPDSKTQINHKNGVKTDNSVDNLEWVTPSENTRHAVAEGLHKAWNIKPHTPIPKESEVVHNWRVKGNIIRDASEEDIHNICQLLECGYRVCDVSAMTGYDRYAIDSIMKGSNKAWEYIYSTYNFSKIVRKEKTSPETVKRICELLSYGSRINEVSKELNVGRKVVSNIRARVNYVDISSAYKW